MKSLFRLLPAFCIMLTISGCGGSGGGSNSTPPPSDGITLQLASSTLTASNNSSASVVVTLTRTGTTGSVIFSLTGLPNGATVSYLHPASTQQRPIVLIPTTAALGTYPLTLQATDGTNSASSSLSLVVNSAARPADPYAWSSYRPASSPPSPTPRIRSYRSKTPPPSTTTISGTSTPPPPTSTATGTWST